MDQHALEALRAEMSACEQMEGLSVLAHGEMVRDRYRKLVEALRAGVKPDGDWRLPEWIDHPAILPELLPDDVVDLYTVYHDCGKPRCLEIDAEGRRHFPDHASVSERTWLAAGGCPDVGRLIGLDMAVHTIKDVDVPDFTARPQALTLLIVGLCEIHANAAMFGGTESVSFKMKYKQIDKRGKAVFRCLGT